MKKNLLSMGLLFCIGAIFSCSKNVQLPATDVTPINPLSDYIVTPDSTDGFTFKFTSLAKNSIRSEWRFGDDTLSLEQNPVHTYLSAGDPAKKFIYTADLRTVSKTGDISHKYKDIVIKPDNILQMLATTTANANELKFGVTAKGDIASTAWTFIDQGPFGAPGATTTSSSATPLKTYVINTVNVVNLTVTTKKGSVATISRKATTAGVVQDITQTRIGYVCSDENFAKPTENSGQMVDGNSAITKFVMGSSKTLTFPFTANFTFPAPVVVKMYAIGNCGDVPKRDPKTWTVEGSNDGLNWTVLDTQAPTKNFYDTQTANGATTDAQRYWKLFYFPIKTPQAFSQYRWKVTSNFGDAKMQTSEFQFYK
jgi:PKD repeat protein